MPEVVHTGSAYDMPVPYSDDTLTKVGRGTPMGELLRRYWHPVCKSDKLTNLPVRARILGEDVILFRRPRGDVGAVYPRCIHRGTTLYYGKVTEDGIRCGYHGWTFDIEGRCTDRPTEPNRGGSGRSAHRQPWYPVEERYGFAFIYMGPLDRKPSLPRYDALEELPDGWELYADDTTIPSAAPGTCRVIGCSIMRMGSIRRTCQSSTRGSSPTFCSRRCARTTARSATPRWTTVSSRARCRASPACAVTSTCS